MDPFLLTSTPFVEGFLADAAEVERQRELIHASGDLREIEPGVHKRLSRRQRTALPFERSTYQ
jgi:hypothetical protein